MPRKVELSRISKKMRNAPPRYKKKLEAKRNKSKKIKTIGGPVFTPDVYGQIENVLTKTLRGTSKRKTGGKLTEKQKKIDMNKDGVIDDKDFKIINADRTGGSTMTKKKHGGGVCARATGQGFGKARKR